MKIGIVGVGVVGGATAASFRSHVESVLCYDVNPSRSTHTLAEVLACDIIFVSLPTPQKPDSNECDTSIVDSALLGMAGNTRTIVLKSTTPIGYTREARKKYNLPGLLHSPEFLTARTAVEDACNPTRNIIGNPREANGIESMILVNLYEQRFPRVPLFRMSSDESEAVKLFQNAFSAIKVATFNEFRCLADARGMDWDRVLTALLVGGWINPMHTQVPGPDGKRGFGGACLPKDTANLAACFDEAGIYQTMASASLRRNSYDRPKDNA